MLHSLKCCYVILYDNISISNIYWLEMQFPNCILLPWMSKISDMWEFISFIFPAAWIHNAAPISIPLFGLEKSKKIQHCYKVIRFWQGQALFLLMHKFGVYEIFLHCNQTRQSKAVICDVILIWVIT